MRYFEKYSKRRKNKNSKVDTSLTIGAGASLGLLGISGSRAYHQSLADPNTVKIRGGTTNDMLKEKKKYHTVFDTQRQSYAKAFRNNGINVNEVATTVTHEKPKITIKGVTTGIPRLKEFLVSMDENRKPSLTIDVGSHTGSEVKSRLSRLFKGLPTYRIFSDLGPGNQHQPLTDTGVKNMMYASKGSAYTRNIIPGGDSISEKAVPAELDNINVKTIATKDKSNLYIKKTKRPLVSLSYGTGYGWQPGKLPHYKENIKNIMDGLDTSYGKGNYNLAILGGPNISPDFAGHFQELSKNNKNVKYLKKTTSKGVHNLMANSDIAIAAPGSVVAELMSREGKKPKVLTFTPESKTSGHFKYNYEWLRNQMPESVRNITFKPEAPITVDEVTNKINELRKGKSYDRSINFDSQDVQKIMSTAADDLSRYKRQTKKMGRIGLAGLGVTGGLLGIRKIMSNRDNK